MHQMGLSKTNTSVEKERIVDFSRGFGNCERCCVGKFVVASDDKRIKGVFRIQICISSVRLILRFWRNFFFFGTSSGNMKLMSQFSIPVTSLIVT